MDLSLEDLNLLISLSLITPTRQSKDGKYTEYRLNYLSIPLLRNAEDKDRGE